MLYLRLTLLIFRYPIVYQGGKGWSASDTGLMFIPIAVGVIFSAFCAPFVNRHYKSVVRKYNGKPPAEARLIPMMFSCWFIPVGLFIVSFHDSCSMDSAKRRICSSHAVASSPSTCSHVPAGAP